MRFFALELLANSREGFSFAAKLPMNSSVEVPSTLTGVRSVRRASRTQGIRCPRVASSIGVAIVTVASLFVVSFVIVPKANAQSEDQIMAAFLFNFARYVEWPKHAFDDRSSPVEICVLGADDFANVVSKTVLGKSVDKRSVAVRPIPNFDPSGDCHILFIGRHSNASHADAVVALRGQSVFSVADREGFASAGGIANFLRADNRVRFEINPTAAQKVGLKISSRLLRLAKVVE
jgi:hypothetical protein